MPRGETHRNTRCIQFSYLVQLIFCSYMLQLISSRDIVTRSRDIVTDQWRDSIFARALSHHQFVKPLCSVVVTFLPCLSIVAANYKINYTVHNCAVHSHTAHHDCNRYLFVIGILFCLFHIWLFSCSYQFFNLPITECISWWLMIGVSRGQPME